GQEPRGAGLARLAHLRKRLGLDLDLDRQATRAQRGDGGADPAGEAQVVVLDENRVVEAAPMVAAAAAADGVLLERSQAGRRLARVEDRGVGSRGELGRSVA